MAHEPTTYPRDWCLQLSAGVVARGIRFEDHLQSLGLDGDLALFRRREIILLLAANAALTMDEGLGLLDRPTPPGSFALRVGTMMTCQTLGAALVVCHSFTRVSRLPIRILFSETGDEARVAIAAEGADAEAVAIGEDIFLTAIFGVLNWLVGRDLPPRRVTTRLVDSPFLGQSHPILRAAVDLDTITSFSFPRSWLDWPVVNRKTLSPIWDACLWFGSQVLSSSAQATSDARVSGHAIAALASPNSATTARREIDWSARHQLAPVQDLIATTDLAFTEIAHRLGFADSHDLRRFVRAQTGLTPSALRKASRQVPAAPLSDMASRIQQAVSSLDLASVQTRSPS